MIVTPFFGSYDFASLEQALDAYRVWLANYVSAGDRFAGDFDHSTVREGDPVFCEYWHRVGRPFRSMAGEIPSRSTFRPRPAAGMAK